MNDRNFSFNVFDPSNLVIPENNNTFESKKIINVINRNSILRWLRNYQSNKDCKNPKIDLFNFNLCEKHKIIILDLHFYNLSYELIKSFNNYFNAEDFEVYEIVGKGGMICIKVYSKLLNPVLENYEE